MLSTDGTSRHRFMPCKPTVIHHCWNYSSSSSSTLILDLKSCIIRRLIQLLNAWINRNKSQITQVHYHWCYWWSLKCMSTKLLQWWHCSVITQCPFRGLAYCYVCKLYNCSSISICNSILQFDYYWLNACVWWQIAVDQGFGGVDSKAKASWLIGVVDDFFRDNGLGFLFQNFIIAFRNVEQSLRMQTLFVKFEI